MVGIRYRALRHLVRLGSVAWLTALLLDSMADRAWAQGTAVQANATAASVSVPPLDIVISVAVSLFLVVLYGAALTRCRMKGLVLGADNRYSNSKCHMVLWFTAVAVAYLTTCIVRGWVGGLAYAGGVDIPADLLTLSGISAATGAGAKAATLVNHATAQQAGQPGKTREDPGNASLFHDLTHNDQNHWDFGDIQMLVLTVVAIVIFEWSAIGGLTKVVLTDKSSLPDLGPLLAAVFGTGLGGYLLKKALSAPGQG